MDHFFSLNSGALFIADNGAFYIADDTIAKHIGTRDTKSATST